MTTINPKAASRLREEMKCRQEKTDVLLVGKIWNEIQKAANENKYSVLAQDLDIHVANIVANYFRHYGYTTRIDKFYAEPSYYVAIDWGHQSD